MGNLHGLLTRFEFKQNLSSIAATAENGQGLNGFTVQKDGKNANLRISQVITPEDNTSSRYRLLADDVVPKIGVYITAHAPKGLKPAFFPQKPNLMSSRQCANIKHHPKMAANDSFAA